MSIERFNDYERKLRKKYGEPNKSIITVSGLTGVGTTTIAKILEEEYDMERYNAGDFFRKEANKRDKDIYDFMENLDEIGTKENRDFDIECDKFLLKLPFKKNDLIIESRLAGVLLEDIAKIRIWVFCPSEKVAKRIFERENKNYKKALSDIRTRNKEDKKRYRKKYDIDLTDDKYYNIIIDNSKELEKVRNNLLEKVEGRIENWP